MQSNSDKLDMAGTEVKIGLSRQDFQQAGREIFPAYDSKLSNFRTLLAFFSFLNCRKTQFAPRLFALVTQWHIGNLACLYAKRNFQYVARKKGGLSL